MKKKIIKSSLYVLVSILVGVTAVYAVDKLTAPSAPANTMYSLTDIFNLSTGTTATEGTGAIATTPNIVTGTGKTLTEVYTAISTEIAKLSPEILMTGNTVFGVEGSAESGTNYGIPQTGQTHCNAFSDDYNNSSQVPCTGTNQDGDLQRGVTRSYTDNANGTITDNATGLMWQKCTAGQSGADCSGDSATSLTMDDGNGVSPAINYCENLSLGGHTDWHLPNRFELESIIDLSKVNPSINTNYFPNTQSDYYWSSTAYEDGAGNAWIVPFYDGYVDYGYMGNSYFVRCVR